MFVSYLFKNFYGAHHHMETSLLVSVQPPVSLLVLLQQQGEHKTIPQK